MSTKLQSIFAGRIVRKDLTKKIKEGANVPVYVLEYLLGMYCSSNDDSTIAEGVDTVRHILADNFVRPDEAQKIISKLREQGSYTVIDKISVKLNYRDDIYEAEFSNLGIKGVSISESYPSHLIAFYAGVYGVLFNWNTFMMRRTTETRSSLKKSRLFKCRAST